MRLGGLLPVLPLVVPLLAAALCLLTWRTVRLQRLVGTVGGAGLLAAALGLLAAVATAPDGVLTLQVGGWPAPFGSAPSTKAALRTRNG